MSNKKEIKKDMLIGSRNRNIIGTTENYLYKCLEKDIEENISIVWDLADKSYGTIDNITKKADKDLERVLNQREIFVKSALETLNNLSLELALNKIVTNEEIK